MRFMIIFTFLLTFTFLAGCIEITENQTSANDPLICMIDAECDEEAIQPKITGNAIKADNPVIVYFFWGDGCPHCADEKPFLDSLKQKYPALEIEMLETWYNEENAETFKQMAESFGTSAQGVPTTFIGDKHWVGFADYMKPEIENYIQYCLENECSSKINQ
jgi:thiol-disulfide isomerase/thioredoxin